MTDLAFAEAACKSQVLVVPQVSVTSEEPLL